MSKGSVLAAHNAATRVKYGKFPAVDRVWDPKANSSYTNNSDVRIKRKGAVVETPSKPLPGRKKIKIEPLPEWDKMSKSEKWYLAENRKDYRQRIRPTLPRKTRKLCYSGELHHRMNAKRIPHGTED